jgi:uncharacterized protein with HEPN domain
MYNDEEIVKLISIKKKLDDINSIIQRHNGIVKALEDLEGQPAILMLLVAIAEQVAKLQKMESKTLDHFNPSDIKGIFAVRNFIAHDYDGVSLGIIEDTLRYKINPFLDTVNTILKECQ